ncbi:MAG: HupE/UreJ family protein, partial [Bacteroidota bacterium]
MSLFGMYLQLGFEHIADFVGYDHILFILTLCGIYILKQWKSVLILVTAFTIGHTTTLALATLRIITVPTSLIEFLIPVTILLTSIFNIVHKGTEYSRMLHTIKYATAMFFGLIHGLGFSNYLRSLLGMEDDIVTPLFAFNVGLEIGQILIVTIILLIALLFISAFKVQRREWNLVISGMGGGVALIMMI